MSRSVGDRLKDIIQSAELAVDHAKDFSAADLADAKEPRDAILFRIAVIGEAVSHLPAEIQALAPEIPWNDIVDMRNHIIHAYWQVDFRIVVDTVTFDLEPLKLAANRLIALTAQGD